MESLPKVAKIVLTLMGVPSTVMGFKSFVDGNPLIGVVYIALSLVFIGIMVFVTAFQKSSWLFYTFNRYFSRCGYFIEKQTVTLDFTAAETAKYSVDIEYKSLVNYTVGVLQKYLERPYAAADAAKTIQFEQLPDALQHNICNSWVYLGWVNFYAVSEKPVPAGKTGHFRHFMFVKDPQKVNGSWIGDIPIKKLIIRVILPSNEEVKQAKQTIESTKNLHRKIHEKQILDGSLEWKISYPVKGHRYAVEWQ
jgi:hypothetical protein